MTKPAHEEDPYPHTAEERQAILQQMERILASAHFSHSKRYPMLSRFLILRTLEGRVADLKERTIGIELFEREADYDTTNDPVVRISAGEVRKRIAQYYHDPGHDCEPRVDLLPGSYIPRFRAQTINKVAAEPDTKEASPAATILAPADQVPAPGELPADKPRNRRHGFFGRAIAFVAMAGIIVAGVIWVVVHRSKSFTELVWHPFYTDTPVLIAIGDPSNMLEQRARDSRVEDITVRQHVRSVHFMVFSDVLAMNRVAELLAADHRPYRLQLAADTTFQDLRQGPAVLLGGFDNPWTTRVLSGLRYRLNRDSQADLYWIEDQKNPVDHPWTVNFTQSYAALGADYAIVARLMDPSTHQPVMVLAGVGENGTKAASEMMTDPNSEAMRTLVQAGIRPIRNNNWSGQSFEIVLGTQVINGVSGPPHILAKVFW